MRIAAAAGTKTAFREGHSRSQTILLTLKNMSTRKAVGIDLGTTFSAVAHIDAYGKPQIIPNSESERITPSVVLFDGTNAIVGGGGNNSVSR